MQDQIKNHRERLPYLEAKLYGISDIDKLDLLADLVIDCQSLKDFENGLV